jgi:outer membrane receptor protein involved in Fe transport
MKTPSSALRIFQVAALFVPFVAYAQIASPLKDIPAANDAHNAPFQQIVATKQAAGDEEPVLQLSPFTVNAERDNGYQATQTLAGTRLNTPLKDLGASISIYTKTFLEDINATDSNDLLIFATGMEAGGVNGNYSGAATDINGADVTGNGPRENPQQATRTRGLASPNFTRDFFTTDIAFDTYNVESVTVNRGPNAILFGAGSPAGVVENSLLRPELSRDRYQAQLRYGNNDSRRASVDINQVLIPQKLGIRIAALDHNERYNQRPAYENKKRLYGALSFEPTRTTAIRLNFETGKTQANRPITVLPYNNVSAAWDAAGRPGYDWTYYDDPAKNPAAASVNGSTLAAPLFGPGQIFTNVLSYFPTTTSTTASNGFLSAIAATGGAVANQLRDGTYNSVFNRDTSADGNIQFYSTLNTYQLPGTYWVGANVLPGQLAGYAPAGIKQQGFTDYSTFDWKNHMIDETSYQGDSFHTYNVAVEQRAWHDRLGLELAYDHQDYARRAKNSFFSGTNGNAIIIDANVTLPNGDPNPNLGRPFTSYSQNPWNKYSSERQTMRATGYLRYDFRDLKASWGKWLGSHTLTGLYQQNTIDQLAYSVRLATDGPAAQSISPDISNQARRPVMLVYLGPSIIGNNNPLTLSPIRVPQLAAGPMGTATYFARAANTADPGALQSGPYDLVEVNAGGSASREVIKSNAAILQSYWLADQLITVVGWRRDEDYFAKANAGFVRNPSNLNDPGKVDYSLDDFNFPSTPAFNTAKETFSYSVVYKLPKRLVKLPGSTEISLFYNKSQNFTPIGGRINAYGDNLPSPQGQTEEYGFNVFAFHDKLSLRINQFKTGVTDQDATGTPFILATQNGTVQLATFWATEANRNPGNVAFMKSAIETLFSVLPANYRSVYNYNVTGSAPTLSATFSSPTGRTDTIDFAAKGMEVELVYNPTRNLRILANVARQETVQLNSYKVFKEFVERMSPIWESLGDIPRNGYPVGYGPNNPPPASVQTLRAWLIPTVYVPYATLIATDGSASAEQRKWRANLVANYEFGQGSIFGNRLKGWSVGGAIRWQDKVGIGYPTTRYDNRPILQSVVVDINHPYYAPAETNVDARIGYKRKFHGNKLEWSVQLNVTNLIAPTSLIPIGVQPWGGYSTVRLAPERRWYLTNTITF